jgi:signal transduction histidine kinase
LLHLQEEERRRIAHELHDSTAQKMTSILLNLRLLQDAENPEQAKLLTGTCVSAAEDCIQEIRTLSYVLHPPLLDELGLAAALDSYVTGFSRRSGIKVNLDVDRGLGELSQDVALALFRMVQESLANVHRHSGSAVASVQLMQTRNRVILEVGDQGGGIAPETLEELKAWRYDRGVGIMGMRERLEQLGGTLEIESSSGGTLVRAIVAVGQK